MPNLTNSILTQKIYLILAHKNPVQLERQIRSLNDGQSTFYVHVDLKSDIDKFNAVRQIKNTTLIEDRVDCIWGDFSMVIATINLIQNVLKNHEGGLCVLMSGNDYPIKPRSHINSYLANYENKVFIDMREANSLWVNPNEFNFKIRKEKYRININSNRGSYLLLKGLNGETLKAFFKGIINFEQLYFIVFVKRKLNLDWNFYGGSQWWAMDVSILKRVHDYIQNNQEILFKYFLYTHVPDEFFFHSIIWHLKETGQSIEIEDTLTYVNWKRKNCKLPVTFEKNDISELKSQPSNKLFARKFDIEFDKVILDELDKIID